MRSPRLIESIGDVDEMEVITEPVDTSHNLMVESRDEDTMLRPTEMIAVDVTDLVCARNVRAGVTLVSVAEESGRSAGRMFREKSKPEERSTLDDGKNFSDTTLLR